MLSGLSFEHFFVFRDRLVELALVVKPGALLDGGLLSGG